MTRTKQNSKYTNGAPVKVIKLATKEQVDHYNTKIAPKLTEKTVAKKQHRYHAGTVARREIIKFQKIGGNLIQRLPFQRLVREIERDFKADARFTLVAMNALQEAAEAFLVKSLLCGNLVAMKCKRKTIMTEDVQFGKMLREDVDKLF